MLTLFTICAIVPSLLYEILPPEWQAVERVVVCVAAPIAFLVLLRKYMIDRRIFRARNRSIGWRWRDGASAAAFQVDLIEHCRGRGWRVFWSKVLDPQRVAFGIQKQQRQLVLLCLGPRMTVSESDVSRVDRFRAENNAERAVIFARPQPGEGAQPVPAGRAVEVLAYDALSDGAILS